MDLDSPLSELSGLGPKTIEKLEKLGLRTAEDLLFYYPRRYEDYTQITKIGDLGRNKEQGTGNIYTIKGSVLGIANKKTKRRRFTVTEAQVADDTGSIKIVWFNQPWLAKMLKSGSQVILNGKVAEDYYDGGLVMESPTRANKPQIVPIYGETVGISSFFISKIYSKIKHLVNDLDDWLPEEIRNPDIEISFESEPEGSSLRVEDRNKSQIPNSQIQNNLVISAKAGIQANQLPGSRLSSTGRDDSLGLISLQEAIANIHEPRSSTMLAEARKRLAFDELFLISLRSQLVKRDLDKEMAPKIETDKVELNKFTANLPFKLTGDQEKAIGEISKDLAGSRPMNRLLSGDVGSGKTVVAAVAAYLTALAGKKAVLMVPTSILATQHFETFCKLFEKYDIKIGLITSERQDFNRTTYNALGIKESEKKLNTKCVIQNTDILIGTHALIQPGMKIDGLALTIVDEQHRFGVRQREALRHLAGKKQDTRNNNQTNFKNQLPKTNLQEMAPHFLSMTATPIPRTMYLALFGDLDVSFLIEKPANRKPVKTRVVDEFNRDKAYRFIRELIKHGRQVFVVCPLVEEQGTGNNGQSDRVTERQRDFFEDERKAVKSEVEKLKAVFPEFEIAMLHGRMKAKDKDAIMADFVANKVQILVSTSVVEVGVDVPNAAVMVVEDAERFGLATLHQFRGRVGRADHQSFCFLFSQTQSEKAIQRLQSLEKISDGYKLAEIDLKTRGFGSILGTEQSGILDMKMADFSDKMLVSMAGEAAKSIADEIDKYPLVMKKISELNTSKHLE